MTTQQADQTLIKSYRYLRLAMVGLVLCLTVAVVHQSVKQGTILGSISAYYYTHAQSIFVGALIAIGVCMIALRGTTDTDDILLNVAGMLAPVVAVVPTARIDDYRSILDACRESGGAVTAGGFLDEEGCSDLQALVDLTEANVANNMLALLVVAYAGLALTLWLARRDRLPFHRFRLGFGIAVGVVALASFVFFRYPVPFVDVAHYAAAIPMFGCIVLVVIINAVRHQKVRTTETGVRARMRQAAAALFTSPDGYARIALLMLLVIVVAIAINVVIAVVILLGGDAGFASAFEDLVFYLEAALILLFGAFWVQQTREQWDADPCPPQVVEQA